MGQQIVGISESNKIMEEKYREQNRKNRIAFLGLKSKRVNSYDSLSVGRETDKGQFVDYYI